MDGWREGGGGRDFEKTRGKESERRERDILGERETGRGRGMRERRRGWGREGGREGGRERETGRGRGMRERRVGRVGSEGARERGSEAERERGTHIDRQRGREKLCKTGALGALDGEGGRLPVPVLLAVLRAERFSAKQPKLCFCSGISTEFSISSKPGGRADGCV